MEIIKAEKADFEGFIELEEEFNQFNDNLKIDRHYKEIAPYNTQKDDYRKDFLKRLDKKDVFFCNLPEINAVG